MITQHNSKFTLSNIDLFSMYDTVVNSGQKLGALLFTRDSRNCYSAS